MWDLLESGFNSDLIIHCQGEDIKAHRLILTARSPVFRAMLETGMVEVKGRIKVEDAKPTILRQLLHYLYTRKLETDFRDYMELLILANKYEEDELVDYTSLKILETLTEENALELGIFGEMHNSTVLLKGCAKFIQEFASEEILPEGWEQQMKGSPRLMLAVIAAVREAGRKDTEIQRFTSSDADKSTGSCGIVYAISFEVSTEAKLSGIGLYGVPGSNKVKVAIANAELLILEENKEYQSQGGGQYTKLTLKSRVKLQPNIVYTILVERLEGTWERLLCGRGGKTLVQVGNVEVTFSNSPKGCEGTDVDEGQIPSLYLQV